MYSDIENMRPEKKPPDLAEEIKKKKQYLVEAEEKLQVTKKTRRELDLYTLFMKKFYTLQEEKNEIAEKLVWQINIEKSLQDIFSLAKKLKIVKSNLLKAYKNMVKLDLKCKSEISLVIVNLDPVHDKWLRTCQVMIDIVINKHSIYNLEKSKPHSVKMVWNDADDLKEFEIDNVNKVNVLCKPKFNVTEWYSVKFIDIVRPVIVDNLIFEGEFCDESYEDVKEIIMCNGTGKMKLNYWHTWKEKPPDDEWIWDYNHEETGLQGTTQGRTKMKLMPCNNGKGVKDYTLTDGPPIPSRDCLWEDLSYRRPWGIILWDPGGA